METITLRGDGALCDCGRPLSGDPLSVLGRAVELADGYRLRAFFLMLGRYPDLARLNDFLPWFMEKYPGWPDKVPVPPGVCGLRLDRTVEMIGYPGPARLEIYAGLVGEDGEEEVEIKPHPVETLLDTPLRLGLCTHKVLGDRFGDMAFATVFSLFEFIEAVSWQLSFHGSPMECALRR